MKRVNSPRVKILYDIYHAQIMDGDIIRNIQTNFQWIGHFHTGGNPGRHEIDETQELNYRFIAQAIPGARLAGARQIIAVDPLPFKVDKAKGIGATHGAACHGCLLISETSCELRNMFLDRNLLIPTMSPQRSAFFCFESQVGTNP